MTSIICKRLDNREEKKRNESPMLWTALADKPITAIIGPRRAGKSANEATNPRIIEGKTNPKNIFFVQLDEPLFETEKKPTHTSPYEHPHQTHPKERRRQPS